MAPESLLAQQPTITDGTDSDIVDLEVVTKERTE
jgi:hypothetical protein